MQSIMTTVNVDTTLKKIRPFFGLSDLLNFFMLLALLAFFMVLPIRNIEIRHIVVFFGTMPFYFLAIRRMLSTRFEHGLFLRLILMLLIIVFGILATADEITWQLIYASLNFYSFFVFLSTDTKLTLSESVYKLSKWIFILIAILLLAYSQSSIAYIFEDGRETGVLVLGMTNPNLAAMIIFGVFSMLLIHFDKMKYKPIIALIMLGLAYLIWLTEARSAFLTVAFLMIYRLFYKNKKMPKSFLLLIMIVPMLFIFIYLQLYFADLENFEFMGKGFFSGRQDTFVYYLSELKSVSHYLFGNVGSAAFENAHNAPLAIMCSTGLFGAALFYWNLAKRLISLNRIADSTIARMAIICILGVCIQTSAEAAMFLGIFPISVFMYFYFLMASSNEQQ